MTRVVRIGAAVATIALALLVAVLWSDEDAQPTVAEQLQTGDARTTTRDEPPRASTRVAEPEVADDEPPAVHTVELSGTINVERQDLASVVRVQVSDTAPQRTLVDQELPLGTWSLAVPVSESGSWTIEVVADGHERVRRTVDESETSGIDVHLRRAMSYRGRVVAAGPLPRALLVFAENSAGRPLSESAPLDDDGRFELRATTESLYDTRALSRCRLVVHDGLSRLHHEGLSQAGLEGEHLVQLPTIDAVRVRFRRGGAPLAEVPVERVELAGRLRLGAGAATVTTDSAGVLALAADPSGRHFEGRIRLDDWVYFALPADDLVNGSQPANVDLDPVRVRVRCELASGAVAVGAHVQLTVSHGNESWNSLRGTTGADGTVTWWIAPGSASAQVELWEARTASADGAPPIEASGLAGWELSNLPDPIVLRIVPFQEEEVVGTWVGVRGPGGDIEGPPGLVLARDASWAGARRSSTDSGDGAVWLADDALAREGVVHLLGFASDGTLCTGELDTAAVSSYTPDEPFALERQAPTTAPTLRVELPDADVPCLVGCHPLGTLRGAGLHFTFELEEESPLPVHRMVAGVEYLIVVSSVDGRLRGAATVTPGIDAVPELDIRVEAAERLSVELRRLTGAEVALAARLVPLHHTIGRPVECTVTDNVVRASEDVFLSGYRLELWVADREGARARIPLNSLSSDPLDVYVTDDGVSVR